MVARHRFSVIFLVMKDALEKGHQANRGKET